MTELLKYDIEVAKKENDELTRLLEMSGTDEFCEEKARERFNLVKSGEIVFIDNYR